MGKELKKKSRKQKIRKKCGVGTQRNEQRVSLVPPSACDTSRQRRSSNRASQGLERCRSDRAGVAQTGGHLHSGLFTNEDPDTPQKAESSRSEVVGVVGAPVTENPPPKLEELPGRSPVVCGKRGSGTPFSSANTATSWWFRKPGAVEPVVSSNLF